MLPTNDLKEKLSHVLWIGGATDAGKSTIARLLAERYRLQVYHYDRHDLRHHQRLAQSKQVYHAFLEASLEERWIVPELHQLFQRALRTFHDRLPLVVEDLLALPAGKIILAEGFGLLPALIAPLLSSLHQAIWLVPTEAFKRASMARRNKPSFASETSNPQREADNLLRRDLLLAELVWRQARERELALLEVDGSAGAVEVASVVERHFAPVCQERKNDESKNPRLHPAHPAKLPIHDTGGTSRLDDWLLSRGFDCTGGIQRALQRHRFRRNP
jgi:2-phosphoglycerate kinase